MLKDAAGLGLFLNSHFFLTLPPPYHLFSSCISTEIQK